MVGAVGKSIKAVIIVSDSGIVVLFTYRRQGEFAVVLLGEIVIAME